MDDGHIPHQTALHRPTPVLSSRLVRQTQKVREEEGERIDEDEGRDAMTESPQGGVPLFEPVGALFVY